MESALVEMSEDERIVAESELLSAASATILPFSSADTCTAANSLRLFDDPISSSPDAISPHLLAGTQSGSSERGAEQSLLPPGPCYSTVTQSVSSGDNVTVLEIVRPQWFSGDRRDRHYCSRSSARKVSCPQCGRKLATPSLLKRHMLIHDGRRPFHCDQCDSSFNQKNALLAHQKSVHSNLRPFVCPHCPASFALRGNLRAHVRSRHAGVAEVKQQGLVCGQCSCFFTRLPPLLLHSDACEDRVSEKVADSSLWTEEALTGLICRLNEQFRSRKQILSILTEIWSSKCVSRHLLRKCLARLKQSLQLLPVDSSAVQTVHPDSRETQEGVECDPAGEACLSLDCRDELDVPVSGRCQPPVPRHDATVTSTEEVRSVSRLVCVWDAVASRMHLARAVYRSSGAGDVYALLYHCLFCQHTSAKVADLTRHLRRHFGDRPFSCSFCDRRFRLLHVLRVHVQRVHGVREQRGETTTFSHCVLGVSEERGETNLSQRVCGVREERGETTSFSQRVQKNGEQYCRQQVETGGKLHVKTNGIFCVVCDKKFSERSALWNHKRRVHGVVCRQQANFQEDLLCANLVPEEKVDSAEIGQRSPGRRTSCKILEQNSSVEMVSNSAGEFTTSGKELEQVADYDRSGSSEISIVNQLTGLTESGLKSVELSEGRAVNVCDQTEIYQVNAAMLEDELGSASVLMSDCRLSVADPVFSEPCSCQHCGKVLVSSSALSQHATSCPPARRRARAAVLSRKQTAILAQLPTNPSAGAGKSCLVRSAVEALTGSRSRASNNRDSDVPTTGLEDRHVCDVCNKRFRKLCDLKRHSLKHSGERPFGCSFCQRRFSHKSNLTTHLRVHTGERNFSCLICGSSFTSKNSLLVHTRVHTGAKPYKCEECGRAFRTPGQLSVHKRTHSKGKALSHKRIFTVELQTNVSSGIADEMSSNYITQQDQTPADIEDSDSLNNSLSLTDFSASMDATVNAGLFSVFLDLESDPVPSHSSSTNVVENMMVSTAVGSVTQPPVFVTTTVPISAPISSVGCSAVVIFPSVDSNARTCSVTAPDVRNSKGAVNSSDHSWHSRNDSELQDTADTTGQRQCMSASQCYFEGDINDRTGRCRAVQSNNQETVPSLTLDSRRQINSVNQVNHLNTDQGGMAPDSSMLSPLIDIGHQYPSSVQLHNNNEAISHGSSQCTPPNSEVSVHSRPGPYQSIEVHSESNDSDISHSRHLADNPHLKPFQSELEIAICQTLPGTDPTRLVQSELEEAVCQVQPGTDNTSPLTQSGIQEAVCQIQPGADHPRLAQSELEEAVCQVQPGTDNTFPSTQSGIEERVCHVQPGTDPSCLTQSGIEETVCHVQPGTDPSCLTQSGIEEAVCQVQPGTDNISLITQSGIEEAVRQIQPGKNPASLLTQSGREDIPSVSQSEFDQSVCQSQSDREDPARAVQCDPEQQRCVQQALRLAKPSLTTCSLCKLQFDNRRKYHVHVNSVHRQGSGLVCSICKQAFPLRTQLDRHMRVHTGHKPFRCLLCSRAFSQKSSLNQHMRLHRGERPHVCPFCQYAFSQRGNLVTHVKRVHLPSVMASGQLD